jgi:hypothetical protein
MRRQVDEPRESLKRGVGLVDLGPHPQQPHESVGLVTRKVLRGFTTIQATKTQDRQLKATENNRTKIMLGKLAGLQSIAPDLGCKLALANGERLLSLGPTNVDSDLVPWGQKHFRERPHASSPLDKELVDVGRARSGGSGIADRNDHGFSTAKNIGNSKNLSYWD